MAKQEAKSKAKKTTGRSFHMVAGNTPIFEDYLSRPLDLGAMIHLVSRVKKHAFALRKDPEALYFGQNGWRVKLQPGQCVLPSCKKMGLTKDQRREVIKRLKKDRQIGTEYVKGRGTIVTILSEKLVTLGLDEVTEIIKNRTTPNPIPCPPLATYPTPHQGGKYEHVNTDGCAINNKSTPHPAPQGAPHFAQGAAHTIKETIDLETKTPSFFDESSLRSDSPQRKKQRNGALEEGGGEDNHCPSGASSAPAAPHTDAPHRDSEPPAAAPSSDIPGMVYDPESSEGGESILKTAHSEVAAALIAANGRQPQEKPSTADGDGSPQDDWLKEMLRKLNDLPPYTPSTPDTKTQGEAQHATINAM